MIHDGNAIIHAGILIAIALLLYHFFIREDVTEGFRSSDAPNNGLAGYPNIDAF